VSNGPLQGQTIHQMLERHPAQMMGDGDWTGRFPLLLKFLDVSGALSIQVHPSDRQSAYLSAGETCKTEAWVVLAVGPDSLVYAGLQPGENTATLTQAIAEGALADHLSCFKPTPGEVVFVPAGVVHALRDIVVFEVQQNSDVTFRLFDWDRVDARTGKPRTLQIGSALASIDFQQVAVSPAVAELEATTPARRERLVTAPQFSMWRLQADTPCSVGADGEPRAVICIEGQGRIGGPGASSDVRAGDVWLLPAEVGSTLLSPRQPMTVLEVGSGQGATR
jgi:mannose-6-phosphate isomerase